MRDKGTRPASENRRPVGLYVAFLDGPLASVQDYLQQDMGRRPTQIEAIEYLYRYWRETRGEARP